MKITTRLRQTALRLVLPCLALVLVACGSVSAKPPRWTTAPEGYDFNDAHVHLTNYVQEGPDIRGFLELMGNRVGRSALFGIPLQQSWSYQNSGAYAPSYYLQSDAPLYYYSFTDAYIAMAYRSLSPAQQARFDPMITGFNPADMYAADHIRRVLRAFPGVFVGIGEFSIHKEFVSSKVSGEVASLTNPALDRILDLAGEAGLLVLIHNDIDMPFAKQGAEPVYLTQMKDLLKRHRNATTIWAHMGLGRVIRPVQRGISDATTERSPDHVELVEAMLEDPALGHVHFDISWDEVAKYIVADPDETRRVAELINHYPDRFLFGTDEVAPRDPKQYFKIYEQYRPLWEQLTPEASAMLRKENYVRLFDQARRKVRAFETAHPR